MKTVTRSQKEQRQQKKSINDRPNSGTEQGSCYQQRVQPSFFGGGVDDVDVVGGAGFACTASGDAAAGFFLTMLYLGLGAESTALGASSPSGHSTPSSTWCLVSSRVSNFEERGLFGSSRGASIVIGPTSRLGSPSFFRMPFRSLSLSAMLLHAARSPRRDRGEVAVRADNVCGVRAARLRRAMRCGYCRAALEEMRTNT